MKRLLLLVCFLFATSAVAEKTVLVRLFWLHPPDKIRVEMNDARVRACEKCDPESIRATVDIDARTATRQIISGSARISGDGFAPFATNGELTIEPRDGVLLLTLKMPLEDYVAAVLNGESAGFKSDEALKAMAVAARTYAVYFGTRHQAEGFDFCDTTHCQDVRLGIEVARVRAAVTATQGELLWYEGRPAATYYGRSCGGIAEDTTVLDPGLRAPYLRRHEDQYCPRDEWHSEITKAELTTTFAKQVRGPVDTVRVGSRTTSGRAQTIDINGHAISATEFRLAIGRNLGWDRLRSDLYELQDRGDRISFRGRGQGNGVGLCQAGADAMGVQGHGYREILAYYYPGTKVGISAQGFPWQKLSGEQIDIFSTEPQSAQTLMPVAERAQHFASEKTGWQLTGRPQIKLYPTLDTYRDATGQPGWIAASTRGLTIRLQPLRTLHERGALDSTLRHEFLHMLVESQARPGLPLWFSEGLVIYLSDPGDTHPAQVDVALLERRLHSARTETELRAAYRDAAAAVAEAVREHGLATILGWVKSGVPQQ